MVAHGLLVLRIRRGSLSTTDSGRLGNAARCAVKPFRVVWKTEGAARVVVLIPRRQDGEDVVVVHNAEQGVFEGGLG